MRAYLSCLTNLHVGSGEANFNIVDREVETDPVTGLPIIHASGLKGALRDDCVARGWRHGTPLPSRPALAAMTCR